MTERDSGGGRRSGDQKNWTGNHFSGDSRNHNGDVNGNITNNYYGPEKRDSSSALEQRNKRLLRAALDGQIFMVEELIDKGVDNEYREESGLTALHCAVLSGYEDVVDAVMKKGFDMNSESELWGTPLHLAVLMSNMSIINKFQRAKMRSVSRILGTVLHCAYLVGDQKIVDKMKLLGAKKFEGQMHAVCPEWMHTIQENPDFVMEGKSLESKTSVAMLECAPHYMAMILPRTAFLSGLSADTLNLAPTCKWFIVVIRKLLDHASQLDLGEPVDEMVILAFLMRSTNCTLHILQQVLKAGINPNERDSLGRTALMYAAAGGSMERVQALLKYGAGLHEQDKQGHDAQWFVNNKCRDTNLRYQLRDLLTRHQEPIKRDLPSRPSAIGIPSVQVTEDITDHTPAAQKSSTYPYHRRRNSITTTTAPSAANEAQKDSSETQVSIGKGYESDQGLKESKKSTVNVPSQSSGSATYETTFQSTIVPGYRQSDDSRSAYNDNQSRKHSELVFPGVSKTADRSPANVYQLGAWKHTRTGSELRMELSRGREQYQTQSHKSNELASSERPCSENGATRSSPPTQVPIMLSNIVYARGIDAGSSREDIKTFFGFCGKIRHLSIDHSNPSTQSATVTFADAKSVETALLLDNTQLGRNKVAVTALYTAPTPGKDHSEMIIKPRLRRSPSDIDYDAALDGPSNWQQTPKPTTHEIQDPYVQAPPPSFNPPGSTQRRRRRIETRTGDLWVNEKLVKTAQGDKWVLDK